MCFQQTLNCDIKLTFRTDVLNDLIPYELTAKSWFRAEYLFNSDLRRNPNCVQLSLWAQCYSEINQDYVQTRTGLLIRCFICLLNFFLHAISWLTNFCEKKLYEVCTNCLTHAFSFLKCTVAYILRILLLPAKCLGEWSSGMYLLYFHMFECKADQKLLLVITEKSDISCSIPGMHKFYKKWNS